MLVPQMTQSQIPSSETVDAQHVVHGVGLDTQSRCVHYHGPTDIIAIRFKCCNAYHACTDCHAALADHPIHRWPADEWGQQAIRCGACGREMTIRAYLDGPPACPACGAAFNPRCRYHHHFYFATPSLPSDEIR
jgi:uncharacterized CHY-type Zn-finger protein